MACMHVCVRVCVSLHGLLKTQNFFRMRSWGTKWKKHLKELNHLFHSSQSHFKRFFFCMSMLISPSHFTLRSGLKCCLKLSRIPGPSEGGQNKTPGNLARVLGWHGPSFWGQVCLLSGPVEGKPPLAACPAFSSTETDHMDASVFLS